MHREAIAGFELSSDFETEALTAMLGMDNGKVGQRLRDCSYRNPGKDDGSWAGWQQWRW